jgi:hypothetical protein
MSAACDSPLEVAKERLRIPALWAILSLPGKPGRSCRSPFREDRNPSFSIHDDDQRFYDHATGQGGDAVDFLAMALGISNGDASRKLIELAGVIPRTPHFREARHTDGGDEEGKARKRESWPTFDAPTDAEIKAIAELRGLSNEAVSLAAEAGLLWCANCDEGQAWIVTDSRRINAQARRMDGRPWERIGAKKAWTLPGSQAAWPVGLREALSFKAIALVEGGPDLLAAFHLAWCTGVEGRVAPLAMLGAGLSIPDDALRHFAGKQVRIFPHMDAHGKKAGERWAGQLQATGVAVDGYSFEGLLDADGSSVGDLNDFVHVCSDQWETDQLLIEEAFLFGPEPPETSTRPDPQKETDDGRPF